MHILLIYEKSRLIFRYVMTLNMITKQKVTRTRDYL